MQTETATIAVEVGTPASVVLTAVPTGVTGGSAFGKQVVAHVQDMGGNLCTAFSGKVSLHVVPDDKCKPSQCVFPFKYYDVTYNSCTDIGDGGQGTYKYRWCSTKETYSEGSGNVIRCSGCESRTAAGQEAREEARKLRGVTTVTAKSGKANFGSAKTLYVGACGRLAPTKKPREKEARKEALL